MKIIIALTLASFVVVARASGGCTDEGNDYNNGEEVTKGCLLYKCIDGSMIFQSGKCKRSDGTCVAVGDEFQNPCSTLKCIVDNVDGRKVYKFETITHRCNINGKCIEVGGTESCIKCLEGGDMEKKCSYQGLCYEEGTPKTFGCYTYTCDTVNSPISFKKDEGQTPQCSYGNSCYDAGTNINVCASCNDDGTLDKTDGCAFKSKDGTETCATHGTHAIHAIGGVDYNCTCTIDNNVRSSSCAFLN